MLEGNNYQGSKYTEPPALSGVAGRAWQVRMLPLGEREKRDHDGCVSAWIINAPGAHPFWSYWIMSIVHLRQIPGAPPAKFQFPGATHELQIVTLNPEHALPSLDAGRGWQPHFLTPLDVVQQFEVANDAIAAELGEMAIRAIVDGRASPDQDYRSWWRGSIAATAAHYRSGKHGIQG